MTDKGKKIKNLLSKIPDRDKDQCLALDSMSEFILLNYADNPINGFAAAAFKNPDTGEIVFAFRGSQGWKDWVLNNSGITLASYIQPQFMSAVDFVFRTLKIDGASYASVNSMLDDLGSSNNISLTGHSLGGALAQYVTYRTANIAGGNSGVKSVTFNAVGIGQNLLDAGILSRISEYNVEDHVNSLDWVGTYGLQHEFVGSDGDNSINVGLSSLAAWLMDFCLAFACAFKMLKVV